MRFDRIDDIILTRNLMLDGIADSVVIEIGRPVPDPDGQCFYCPYRILGNGRDRIFRGAGIDSVQALLLTLSMVGVELYTSENYKAGRLHWLELGNRDLGFPSP